MMPSSDEEMGRVRVLDSNQRYGGNDNFAESCDSRNDAVFSSGELRSKSEGIRCNTSPEYLAQLLSDKKKLQSFPGLFVHLEKLLDEGPIVTLSEKLAVPVNEYPDYNFVGRILGPRGRTAKQLEQDMDCKIMIRGKGSTRNACKMLDSNKSKQHQEHQNEDLHILISVEDAENRAKMKLQLAVEQVKKLLIPAPEGEDSLKKKQLMELAIINGTYRETRSSSSPSSSLQKMIGGPQLVGRQPLTIHTPSLGLLTPSTNSTPIILTQARVPLSLSPSSSAGVLNGCLQRTSIGGQSLIGSSFINGVDASGGILVQFDPNIVQPTFIDLAYPLDSSQAGGLLLVGIMKQN